MNGLDGLSEWLAALLIASSAWLTTVATDSTSPSRPDEALTVAPGWAQDADDIPIEQTEEGDTETLDQGVPPAEPVAADVETGDSVPVDAASEEDVELLDQGTPPLVQPVSVEPVPAAVEAAAPVAAAAPTTYEAPASVGIPATGPVLPPGFGTGRVHVSAGPRGFPVGLASCHVGAVTGRAYVGLDCGDHDTFVGHAPSFDEFPFVVDAEFPFDDNTELPLEPAAEAEEPANDIFVSNVPASADFLVADPAAPEALADGSDPVVLAQKTRDRKPRATVQDQDDNRTRSSENRRSSSASVQRAGDSRDSVKSESKKQSAKDGKERSKEKDKGKGKKEDNKRNKDKNKKKNANKRTHSKG